ncbi:metacaspase-2-like isoform X2 [Diabrotica virgifera virgifera]|uniref:Uncharacterized protein n=1 Tax=Diabrotica virgifera virgifera TaxID=50390 RepID=A0ABM5KJS8_DIAVI|nr:metacaspase-2-like isoform X2 [Diabrotica virgifera virgifera]
MKLSNLGGVTCILIISLNIVRADQDFLEYYQPRPDLPKELNEWLAFVQEHKKDFKAIKNIVKRRNREQNYYDEIEEAKNHKLLSIDEDQYVDEAPHNDIYPHFNQELNKIAPSNLDTTIYKKRSNKKSNKFKNSHKSNRARRHSSKEHFFETHQIPAVEPNGQKGEIHRSDRKFPERYQQDNQDKYNKREIQINVLKDGKLIKSIEENEKDSKSLVFNIEARNDDKNSIEENSKNLEVPKSPLNVNNFQRSLHSNSKERKDNIMTVNEKLNIDTNTADQILKDKALFYQVTMPNHNLIHQPLGSHHPRFQSNNSKFIPHQNVPEKQNQFYGNNFKDMSKFWTASEKDRLQKGIEFAQDNPNLKNGLQDNGFEAAKSIVVEANPNKYSNIVKEPLQLSLKRNLDTEGGSLLGLSNYVDAAVSGDVNEVFNKNKILLDQNSRHKETIDWSIDSLNDTKKNQNLDNTEPTDSNTKTVLDNKDMSNGIENNQNLNVSNIYKTGENHTKVSTDKEVIENVDKTNNINLDKDNIAVIPNSKDTNINTKNILNDTSLNSVLENGRKEETYSKEQQLSDVQQKEKGSALPSHSNIHTGHENINNHIEITIIEPKGGVEKNEDIEEIAENNSKDFNADDTLLKIVTTPEDINDLKTPEKIDDHMPILKVMEPEKPIEKSNNINIDKENDLVNCDSVEGPINEMDTQYLDDENFPKNSPTIKVIIDDSKSNNGMNDLENNSQKRYFHHTYHKLKKTDCHGDQCDLTKRLPPKKFFRRRKHPFSNYINNKRDSYKLRQLKSLDYVYDADIEAPVDEEYVNEEATSKREYILAINKKGAVEGDYGDEEDSAPSKSNKLNQIIKKSDNIFADPRTVASRDEDDDGDYYEEEHSPKNETVNSSNNGKVEIKEQNENFGKRRHPKPKPAPNTKKKKPHQKEIDNKKKNYVREPRSQADTEDIGQAQKFVRKTQDNLASNKKQVKNKFPLSSKGFFTNNDVKRDSLADIDKPVSVDSPKIDVDDIAKSALALNNSDLVKTTLFNFNQVPNGCVSSTISPEPITEVVCEEVTPQVAVGNMCENETVMETQVVMTTILSIIPDVQHEMNKNNSFATKNDTFEKLDEVLSGQLPISLVSSVYDHMKDHPTFKNRFYSGMKRRHYKESLGDFENLNQREHKELLNVMEDIINKLQWTTNCQMLPKKQSQYLRSITRAKSHDALSKTKQMEEVDFDDGQDTKNFIFHAANADSTIEQKIKTLHEMLVKFEQLPPSCKSRAEPVKKYIETHMEMLNKVLETKPRRVNKVPLVPETRNYNNEHQQPIRRNDQNEESSDLIEKQLQSVGLGKNPNFKPNFDINHLVQQNRVGQKVEKEGKVLSKNRHWRKRSKEI